MTIALRTTLLSAALLDELTFGFLTIALPLLRDQYHLTYSQTGFLFTAGALSSMLVEPVVNLLSDRRSKRLPILIGAVILAITFLLVGVAPNYLFLILTFAVIWPAIGAAVDLSQAALVDAAPDDPERTMTRWTLLSGVGDLLSPLALGALAALALGWLAVCIVAAALWLAFALIVAIQPSPTSLPPSDISADEEQPGLVEGLRAALRNRALLRWMVVVLLADMMDEVFLAFAALYLRDHLHFSPGATSLAIGAGLAGGLASLIILDRAAGHLPSRAILPCLALLAGVGVAMLVLAPAPWVGVVGLFLADTAAAGWYPLAKGSAYATLPGRTGTVRALLGLGEPYNVALPALTGLIASHWGLGPAVAFLGTSCVGVLLVTPRRTTAPVALGAAAR